MQENPFEQFKLGEEDNPLLRSMETMRKAWASMPDNPLTSMTPLQLQSTEELDKRINELQTVENWLALNLSMLRNTIQALEIQRTTLNTLQNFAHMQWAGASEPSADESQDSASTTTTPEGQEALMKAGQAWWDLMQQQFQTLVQTTQSSLQAASADTTFGKTGAASKSTAKKSAAKTAAKKTQSAKKSSAKKAAKKGRKAAKKGQGE